MEFDKGMAGVLVVVLSLIASVLLGVVTNIESRDVTKDEPEYVADITGGFTADREKSYTDYNSARNYNGYTNNTVTNQYAIDFNSVGYTNNYPLSHRLDQTTSSSIHGPSDLITSPTTFDSLARYAGWDTVLRDVYVNDEQNIRLYTQSSYVGSPCTWGYLFGGEITYMLTLSSVLSECVTDGTTELGTIPTTVQIIIPSTVQVTEIEYPYAEDIAYFSSYFLTNNIMIIPSNSGPSSIPAQWYSRENLIGAGVDSAYDTEILYTPSTNTCTISINDVPIWSGVNPTNYKIVYGKPFGAVSLNTDATEWGEEHGYSDSVWRTRQSLGTETPHFTVNYLAESVTDFIDTRYGVGVRNSEEVVWNNNQQNGITSIAFSVWNDTSETFTDIGDYLDTGVIRYYGSNATDTFTVSRVSGRTYVALNGSTPIDIGTWSQIQLNIDNINGTLTAYPITAWNNFNNYIVEETSVTIGTVTKGSLSTITWTANNSFRFQVMNTTVFFNTYGVVMINPYITISNLWPNYSRFMVSFTKVATIGDSITLGGSTYPITDGMIEINGETLTVPDIELYYESVGTDEWQVTLSTTKASTQITVPNTNISLSGTWYFNAGFYDIVTKHVKENIWNPIYIYDMNLIVLFMAGFLLLGGIIIYKLGYADVMSIIIIVASEIILIVIGGAT
ncbi:MAG: hypothetical protein IIY21_04285 [Clostridiales bacterium]|nr:hypothetical protein [Clostridiales bacterium]MBQ1573896.1 hypothetical protein [Clostridiales bacterium]